MTRATGGVDGGINEFMNDMMQLNRSADGGQDLWQRTMNVCPPSYPAIQPSSHGTHPMRILAAALGAVLAALPLAVAEQVLTFEAPAYTPGPLSGQDQWQGVNYGPTARATIVSPGPLSGSQSVRNDGMQGRSDLSRPFAAGVFSDGATITYLQQIVTDSGRGVGSGLYFGSEPGGGWSPVFVRFVGGEIQAIQRESDGRRFRTLGKYHVGKTYEVRLKLNFTGATYDVIVRDQAGGATNGYASGIPMFEDRLPDPAADTIGVSLVQEGGVALFDDLKIHPGSPVAVVPRPIEHLLVRLSWGHKSATAQPFHIGFITNAVEVTQIRRDGFEAGDMLQGSVSETRGGAGDVDAVTADVSWPKPAKPPLKPQSIWQHLLNHGEPGQVARLKDDPGLQPGAPLLTVLTAADGTRGFSIGLEQLARHKTIWLPEHDVFVTPADAPVHFAAHLASLKGERVLNRVRHQPEATLAEWKDKWADFGNPTQTHHGQETEWLGTKGHLTGFAPRHGSIYKFGVDRWGRARPDLSVAHKFRFDPLWSDWQWTGQRIVDGLPILVTTCERAGRRCEVEQIVEPLRDTPQAKRGEIPGVLLSEFRFSGTAGPLNFGFRLATESTNRHPELREVRGRWCVVDRETSSVWLMVEPGSGLTLEPRAAIAAERDPRIEFDCVGELAAGTTCSILVKLPSPAVLAAEVDGLAALDFVKARAATVQYWEGWLAQGARFDVPEKSVNDLFRANLWHALMLPRFRDADRIDLPYSNFAYGQFNADWPINQAVYVDYMLYGLRGHFAVAEEEFAAMYRSQQKPDGRVGGFAEWGVYSPGMIYSIAQNFLLSGDRTSFERLLPPSLKALDWCLKEVARGRNSPGAPGLVVAPLNDLNKDARAWAFPNAYFVAGLELFARALAAFGHPRTAEVQATAGKMRADVTAAFARASVRSPAVQLADGTWNNYVPCDAMAPRRLLDQWYPTDVDTGALHLSRLAALDPRGWLSTALLHDHEDNLFLNQWGMANEPVYNQQAIAYLYRDEPESVIRAFYSMMACAFSHHQLTPLEHRWAWGQYYMPPSTDGAWFELYRNMLVNELSGDGTLFIGQAVPRAWLADGKRITVTGAPTYFGPVSFLVDSQAAAGEIAVTLDAPSRQQPVALLVRLRHPQKKPLQSVTVNSRAWSDFDVTREWIRIPNPTESRYRITARY